MVGVKQIWEIRLDALENMKLHYDGMESATEMIAEASRKGLRIGEVSVPLKKAQNERQEKLRTIRVASGTCGIL